MIKVQNNTTTREPLPAFLRGLAPESLADLSWTDPQLGVRDAAWWPEEDQSEPLPEHADYGAETLEPDETRKVVIVRRAVVPWSVERFEQEIESVKAAKRQEAEVQYTARAERLASSYSQYERESWPVQLLEARAFVEDAQTETHWLDAASAARGITKADLAQRVIAMDTAYRQVHGALTGYRQKLVDQIDAAQDLDTLSAIDPAQGWPAQ